MRLALIGPPGAGKGTQAARLAAQRGLTSISTGEMIRQAVKAGHSVGSEAQAFVQDGRLVPGPLVRQLAERAIEAARFGAFILDGYPRTREQAGWLDDFLEQNGSPLHAMVCLRIEDAEIISRLSGRRIHRTTGETYHLHKRPPPPDVAPRDVVQRADDRPDAVARRLVEYRAETVPVESHYRERGILVEVDGTGMVGQVHRRLVRALDAAVEPGT